MILTAPRLRELVRYEPDTGIFYWLDRDPAEFKTPQGYGVWKSLCRGKEAGIPTGHGYTRLWLEGASYLAHRLAWLYVHGEWPSDTIDHINGCGTDNRIKNLRDIPARDNQRNMKRCRRNSSGVTGVRLTKYGTWVAAIWQYGISVNLGTFETREEAAEARKQAERDYGYHPNHGRAA